MDESTIVSLDADSRNLGGILKIQFEKTLNKRITATARARLVLLMVHCPSKLLILSLPRSSVVWLYENHFKCSEAILNENGFLNETADYVILIRPG